MQFDILRLGIAVLLLVGTALGILYWHRLSVFLRIVHAQLCLGFMAELTGNIALYYNHGNTTPIYNSYILAEQLLLTAAAFTYLKPPWLVSVLCYACYGAIWAGNIYQSGLNNFANHSFLAGCIIIVAIYILLLIKLSGEKSVVITKPMTWTSAGILLYFGGDIPLFSMFEYLTAKEHKEFGFFMYTINEALAIGRYVIIILAIHQSVRLYPKVTPELWKNRK